MKCTKKILSMVLMMLLVMSFSVMGFESERMDYGNVDFGGETVTFVSWAGEGFVSAFVEGGDYAGRLEEAKEKFNIGSFDFVQTEWTQNGETMRQRLMSGDSNYDIWYIATNMDLDLVTTQAAYPLSSILPDIYFENLPRAKGNLAKSLSIRGDKYFFSGMPINLPVLLAWNKTVFEREGLTTPYELYENDEWNWDNFEKLAIEATRDRTGDGEIDQFGLEGVWVWNCYPWVYANGGPIHSIDEDGRWIWTADQPATVHAFERVLKWINEDRITGGTHDLQELKVDNAAMAMADHVPLHHLAGTFGEVDVDYGVVPMPMGPHADRYNYPMYAALETLIPINSSAPVEKVALMDFLWPNEEYEENMEEMVINIATDEISYQVLNNMLEEMEGEGYWLAQFLGMLHTHDPQDLQKPLTAAVANIASDEQSAAVALQEVSPQAQAIIDDIFDQ